MPQVKRGRYLFILGALLVLVAIRIPDLYASFLSNWATLALNKTTPCDPTWFVCSPIYPPIAWTGNRDAIMQAASLLGQARQIRPDTKQISTRLADVRFALGERQAAASLLPPVLPAAPMSWDGIAPASMSPLLASGSYQGSLIGARQAMTQGDWQQAVEDFRLAFAVGEQYLLPVDYTDYWQAVAYWHAQRYQTTGNTHEAYLAGKYFVYAEMYSEARTWLRRIATDSANSLTDDDKAYTQMYRGVVSEQLGDDASARKLYELAAALVPTLREPRLRLLSLLSRLGDSSAMKSATAELVALGPTYILGRFGENYHVEKPAALENRWTLVGYDLDTESLENGGKMNVWLWWKPLNGIRPNYDNGSKVGDYLVQRQSILNLVPNPGFEWGEWPNHLPFGYWKEVYTGKVENITVVSDTVQGSSTTVARMENVTGRQLGIISRRIPVDESAWYLTSGWKKDNSGQASIGRQCSQSDFGASYYISYEFPDQPRGDWLHFSDVAHPLPDHQPTNCVIFLLNYETDGWAEWDRLIFARIDVPG
jgi:tetratricopeptide (TPR) repeat protein